MVAAFSEELSSWGGPFCIPRQQDSLPQDATGSSVPVPPSIRPTNQSPGPIPVATLQPEFQRAPRESELGSSVRKRNRRSRFRKY